MLNKLSMLSKYLVVCQVLLISCSGYKDCVSIVKKPDSTSINSNYLSNRAPLKPSMFIKLPVGTIRPKGWLNEFLVRQKNGLTGNLKDISSWLQKQDNAWLSKDGKGLWGWEEVPYWLKGYGNIGYILNDPQMITETKIWIEGVINSQQPNGYFGPQRISKDGSMDLWGNMIMLYCLQSYYEYSGDVRIIDLMTKYFKYQLGIPKDKFLTNYWDYIRACDNLNSVIWLYNLTGDKFLLELAEKIHNNSADWIGRGHSLDSIHSPKHVREGMESPRWFGDLIDWHNVNIAQCFREPAEYYLLSKDEKHLKAAYDNFEIIRKYFGQVPGGMFGADENARPGYDDPRQGIETCGIVEQMNSDENMLRITGDSFWADHVEEVAFNTYPASTMPDFKSLHYLTSPNMVLCDDQNHAPGIDNTGPFLIMNPFSSRCCQHNHAQGWPYLVENLWMASPDNGVVAAIYSASEVDVIVGKGTKVTINEKTNYPYEEQIQFTVNPSKSVRFPLYLRIPQWCKKASITINGDKVNEILEPGKYIRIERVWEKNDNVVLDLPMELSVKQWTSNHNSVSVSYGPLTFSLKIKEKYVRRESEATAMQDSKWQKGTNTKEWPSWEIFPDSKWNYGLILNLKDLSNSFKVVKREWPKDDFPFTHENNPISIIAKGALIPEWKMDQHNLCGELMDSPVMTNTQIEEIELVPMGSSRLRISAFPVIKK